MATSVDVPFTCGPDPLDEGRHLDGVVEVELHDAAAPAGTLKALNPPSAVYVGGTCGNVSCHSSGTDVTCHQGTYATVVRVSAQWGGTPNGDTGNDGSCNFCH